MNHFLKVTGLLGVLLMMILLAWVLFSGGKGEMFFHGGGQLLSQLLDEHGDRPNLSSCLNTEPAHRALIKFSISQNKHILAEVSGVVPIFTT